MQLSLTMEWEFSVDDVAYQGNLFLCQWAYHKIIKHGKNLLHSLINLIIFPIFQLYLILPSCSYRTNIWRWRHIKNTLHSHFFQHLQDVRWLKWDFHTSKVLPVRIRHDVSYHPLTLWTLQEINAKITTTLLVHMWCV